MGVYFKCYRKFDEFRRRGDLLSRSTCKATIKSISRDKVQYELEGRHHFKVVLPKNELIVALLDGAEEFFKSMEEYFKGKCNYQYEIDKIASLRDRFKQQR